MFVHSAFLNIPNNISIYQMPKLSRCNKIIWYLRSLLRQVFYEELLFLLKERNYFFSRLHSLIAFIGLGERVFIFSNKRIYLIKLKDMIRSVIVIGCIMELMLQFVLRKSFQQEQ